MRISVAVAVLVPLVVAGLGEGAGAAAERAPENEALGRITEMNRAALRMIQHNDFVGARKTLKEALELCDSQSLEAHPIKARTHVHLGAVLVTGFGQRELGIKQFQKARHIQPEIGLTPNITTPAVEQAFQDSKNDAKNDAKSDAKGDAKSDARDTPAAAAAAPDAEGEGPGESAGQPTPASAPRSARAMAKRETDDEDDEEDDDRAAAAARKYFVALSVGSGVGWASGTADLNSRVQVENPGFALASLGHVVPEVGYWLRPSLRVSLEGRLQRIVGATDIMDNGRTYRAANYAAAGFAKATWLIGGRMGKLQPFVSAAIGGGQIRHVVTFTSRRTCGASGMETCVDTVAAGPLLLGGGAGLTYDLGSQLALIAALNTQLGAPRFTFNLDANLGLALRL